MDLSLAEGGVGRRAVLAGAVRLLHLGFFRVGGEAYADEHSTYGLATLRKDHVTIEGDALVFEYDAKDGKHRVLSIVDDDVRRLVTALKRRRGGGDELLSYKDERGRWRDVRSSDINDHLRELSDIDTPAVCRKSYVDPKVVDLFEQGITIAPALEKLGSEPQYGLATQGAV